MSGNRTLFALVLSLSVMGVAQGGTITYSLDPRSSFLLASPLDNPALPLFIPLSSLQLSAGQRVTIQMSGSMSYWADAPIEASLPFLLFDLGVFTADDSVGPTTSLNRLTVVGDGPPEGGVVVLDPDTFYGSLPTDIPQDFKIPFGPGSVTVTIPQGANFLAVAVFDSFYGDNNAPTDQLIVSLAEIPEPATCGLFVIGLSGIFALYRRRAHRRP